MKYGQLILGLISGTALGALAISSSPNLGGSAHDKSGIEQIVRDVIANEPKLIIESVQKFQADQRNASLKGASDALKDSALRAQIFDDGHSAFVGPKDAKKVVVEYYDYNCPACKAQFRSLDELIQKNKDVKVILKEYPIFGPTSDTNSKIGLAIWKFNPEKYFDFHRKMLTHEGRVDEKIALGFAASLGLDTKKIQAFVASPEASDLLKETRAEGEKLSIQGTPTLILNDEVVPHALSYDEMNKRLSGGNDVTAGTE
jgi:protein-disulfide isomerase